MKAEGGGHVLYVSGVVSPVLEGLQFTNGSAAMVRGGLPIPTLTLTSPLTVTMRIRSIYLRFSGNWKKNMKNTHIHLWYSATLTPNPQIRYCL